MFPQRFAKAKVEAQFKKFVPFTEALSQMPTYAKLLTKILYNKRKLEDHENVPMNVDSGVVVQNMFPYKVKDPESFSIPCQICTMEFKI